MKTRQQKRDEAAVRQAAYDQLTLEEKLARARKRGGDSTANGRTREVKRLIAVINGKKRGS